MKSICEMGYTHSILIEIVKLIKIRFVSPRLVKTLPILEKEQMCGVEIKKSLKVSCFLFTSERKIEV